MSLQQNPFAEMLGLKLKLVKFRAGGIGNGCSIKVYFEFCCNTDIRIRERMERLKVKLCISSACEVKCLFAHKI